MEDFGILSLLPALTALVLAFITREAIFSLLVGVLVGILVTGENLLFGFTAVVQESLGNADSLGAGSDHMDHVRTQLPYALSVGAVSVGMYFAIGAIL